MGAAGLRAARRSMAVVATLKRDRPALTVREFDAFIDAQSDDAAFELVAGEIVMMSNPTEPHEQIAGNIGAPLKLAMDPRGCRVYQGGMRVQRSDDVHEIHKFKPDVLVRCGPVGTGTYVTDPIAIIEVLSPTTMDMDRGPKLDFYKTLPTLRHIVLAYQDQTRAEHYFRTDAGWERQVLTRPTERLVLDAVAFEIGMDRIYFGVPV